MKRSLKLLPGKVVVSLVTLVSSVLLQNTALAQTANSTEAESKTEVQPENKVTELFLSVYLNGYDTKTISLFLQDEKGNLYIQKDELENYGLSLPPSPPLVHDELTYYPIASFTEGDSEWDTQNLTINLKVPASNFKSNTYQADTREYTRARFPKVGGFFNYQVYGFQGGDTTMANAFLEPGVYCAAGSGTSNFLSLNSTSDSSQSSFVRLNTTWEIDYPSTMTSLYLGDSVNAPGLWGNSVGFGGIQWGTNFGTQPAFVTYPLPSYRGEVSVPSVIDLYVNRGLLDRQSVEPGQFTINEIPVVNGAGTMNVVITDLLGREQTISIPYYSSTSLLKPGVHDFSVSLGFTRLNYGYESNDYGEIMAVVTDQVGLTDILTGEWRVEALRNQQTIGGGAIYLLGDWATVTSSAAGSRSEFGGGGLLELGFQRQSQTNINFGFNLIATSPNFTQIGFGEDTVAPSFQGQYFAAAPLLDYGSLSLMYTQQNNRDAENVGFFSGTYMVTLGKTWALNLSAFSQVQGGSNNSVALVVSRMLDEYTSVNLGGNAQKGVDAQGYGQLNRALPVGPGWGYNLYAAPGGNQNYSANVSGQNAIATATIGANRQSDQMSYQGQVAGSIAVVDYDFYLARQLGAAFGVVQVGDYENVRVYNYNQVVDITDKNGKAFMPNLLPYQNNVVAIEANDLPIGTELRSAEAILVPYFQSGYLVPFPVESNYSATARLVDSKGDPLPSGSIIKSENKNNQLFVAENGEVYLNKLEKGKNTFHSKIKGKECTFSINFVVNPDDEMPDFGTVVCKPVSK